MVGEVLEYNVFARMRGNGLSHVRASTCLEFLRGVLRFRFSSELRQWRKGLRATQASATPTDAPGPQLGEVARD
jgi:hypothetical protein